MPKSAPNPEVIEQLADLFRRNGYLRWPNRDRQEAESGRGYKKGYEVRLVANSRVELRAIRRLLRSAGFAPGKPFAKAQQWRQPLYGLLAVARFLRLIGWFEAGFNPKPTVESKR